MSIEEIRSDYAAICGQLADMNPALTSTSDVVLFLRNNLVPFQENLIAELAEMDETVSDIYHRADDILQPETGGMFAAVIAGGMGFANQLKARLTKSPDDQKLVAAIKEWEKLAMEACETLDEITIPDADDDEDEDEEEGDEDEDDGDEGDDDEEESEDEDDQEDK